MDFRGDGYCSDHVGETIQVAAVTKPKPPPDQLEDLLRRFIINITVLLPQKVRAAAELTQRLMAEIRSLEPQPTPDQVKDQLTRLMSNGAAPVPVPAPIPQLPTGNKLLLCRVAETQSRQPVDVVSPTDIGTTNSADASRKESGWRRMFFLWKVGAGRCVCAWRRCRTAACRGDAVLP